MANLALKRGQTFSAATGGTTVTYTGMQAQISVTNSSVWQDRGASVLTPGFVPKVEYAVTSGVLTAGDIKVKFLLDIPKVDTVTNPLVPAVVGGVRLITNVKMSQNSTAIERGQALDQYIELLMSTAFRTAFVNGTYLI